MKVKELYTDDSKWTQRTFVRDSYGNALTSVHDPNASCFCLSGALIKCYPINKELCFAQDRLLEAVRKFKFRSIVAFNDNPLTTFEQVRALVEALDI